MARIPESEIERFKKEIPIERLMTGCGVELKRQGSRLSGRARAGSRAGSRSAAATKGLLADGERSDDGGRLGTRSVVECDATEEASRHGMEPTGSYFLFQQDIVRMANRLLLELP